MTDRPASTYPPERLVAYDPEWVNRFERLAADLRMVLGRAWTVEHIGSTSVPGLVAKPVIDLAVRLPPGERLDDRDAYARLEHELVASDVWGRAYTSAKTEFVQAVVDRAQAAQGLDPVPV